MKTKNQQWTESSHCTKYDRIDFSPGYVQLGKLPSYKASDQLQTFPGDPSIQITKWNQLCYYQHDFVPSIKGLVFLFFFIHREFNQPYFHHRETISSSSSSQPCNMRVASFSLCTLKFWLTTISVSSPMLTDNEHVKKPAKIQSGPPIPVTSKYLQEFMQ